MGTIRLPLLLTLGFALTGCSLDASLLSLNASSPIVLSNYSNVVNKAVTSQQKGFTIENGYSVQSSSGGSITDGIADRTPAGYTVFTSTQGALFDDAAQSAFVSGGAQAASTKVGP